MITRSHSLMVMSPILHVPSIFHNFHSVHTLTKNNRMSVEFFFDSFLLKDLNTGKVLCKGENKEGFYCLSLLLSESIKSIANVAFSTWHQRLRHSNNRIV